jgi:iron complex outermembrane receptor protein
MSLPRFFGSQPLRAGFLANHPGLRMNPPRYDRFGCPRAALIAIFLSLLAAPIHAQLAPGESGAPRPAEASKPVVSEEATVVRRTGEEDVVQLSPFSVDASEDSGYRAHNTLAGSRLNSSLRDTPGVLDVLTADFLDDIGVTTLSDALNYSTNFAEDLGDFDSQGVINTVFPGSQANVNFRTRGLGGTIARNYLETDTRPAFYTVERIDNSSGPNSILFGLGSAGGVANITTKRAKLNRNAYGLDFRYDSNESKRVVADVNQVLIPKVLGFRVNAIADHGKRYRANFSDKTYGIHGSGTWRPTGKTEIRFEYEQEHTTGSVAYPGPHLTNTYVTNWLTRGSPVYDLPANWGSLTTAQRNALVNPSGVPTAFNYIGGTVSPVVVQNGDTAYIFNASTSLFSNASLGSNDASNVQTVDPRFYNARGNINGPGGRKTVDREVIGLAIDQKVTEDIYVNLSAAREESFADTYQAFANGAASGATILVDGNGTLTNSSQALNLGSSALSTNAAGQLVNPFAGQFYTQSRWLHRTQHSARNTIQATAAWQGNFGRWLGSHRVVATGSYWERTSGSENFRDSWLYAPFNNDPINTNNGVVRRQYASPLDAEHFHVPDWRDFPTLTWNHPTRGSITTGWVSEGENLREARQASYLIASQSRFFNKRLVLTVGYRRDEATDYVYGQTTVKPIGWEASNGLSVLDRTKITKTKTSGPTRTMGGVLHLTKWMSAYANKSTNFGPPRGNTVGPDAVTPPNTAGEGLDTGLKFTLLAEKIYLDVGYFDTASNDVTEVLTMNLNSADSIRGAYNAVFPILNAPVGASQLFNTGNAAAIEALKAKYPLLRPVYNANADMLDQASRGYEARLTANPFPGLRLRATYSKTARERENLYRFTLPMSIQLREYINDLGAANPGVNVGSLTIASNPGVTINDWLDALDQRLENNIDSLSNNFGGGRFNANFTATYDFRGRLKGVGTTVSTRYRSGAYNGAYEVREGGVSSGKLVETVPVFGQSTTDLDMSLRYRTKLRWMNNTRVTFQLNVNNVLDESDPLVRRVRTLVIAPGAAAPKKTDFVVSSYFIRLPRAWSLSANFDY